MLLGPFRFVLAAFLQWGRWEKEKGDPHSGGRALHGFAEDCRMGPHVAEHK